MRGGGGGGSRGGSDRGGSSSSSSDSKISGDLALCPPPSGRRRKIHTMGLGSRDLRMLLRRHRQETRSKREKGMMITTQDNTRKGEKQHKQHKEEKQKKKHKQREKHQRNNQVHVGIALQRIDRERRRESGCLFADADLFDLQFL